MGSVPNRLLENPNTKVDKLPVESRLQKLPYDELTWENFERLCLRLAQQESEVEDCRLYGTQGDSQEGIDIYAKTESSSRYSVYQCKRQKNFGPQKIKEAVSTFLVGEWLSKSERFVLCTQEGLGTKQREDAINAQRIALNGHNVSLKIWDSNGLDAELKKHPKIVFDFFGEHWTQAFCGPESIKGFGKRVKKNEFDEPSDYIPRKVVTNNTDILVELTNQGKVLKEIIVDENRIALLGDAGTGKSIELRKLCCDLSLPNSIWYPFLIELNTHSNKSIQDYIPELSKISESALVICLDGLDEVQTGNFDTVARKILELAKDFPRTKIIVSCRSNFYTSLSETNRLTTLQGFNSFGLADLSWDGVNDYLSRKLPLSKNEFLTEVQNKDLYKLLIVPYYLIKLSDQFSSKGHISNNKAELFEEVTKENIENDVARHYAEGRASKASRMRNLLEKLAFILVYQGKNQCTWNELEILFTPNELDLLKRAGSLLNGSEGNEATWKFNHNNTQEYLVAKFLSRQSFSEIKRIIAFRPNFKKVKPTWVNTLSFLITLLHDGNKLRGQLLSWLTEHEPELIVKFEPDKLDRTIRHQTFIKILDYYKKEGRVINRTKYSAREVAKFSTSVDSLNYLIKEIQNKQVAALNNALELISYFKIQNEFPESSERAKEAIEECFSDSKSSIQYLAIKAYVNCFNLSKDDFASLLEVFIENSDTWIRFILFQGIHKCGFQDDYLDLVIEQIRKLMSRELTDSGRLSNEYHELRECLSTIKSKGAVSKALDFLAAEYGSIVYSIYFREIIDDILGVTRKLFPTDEDLLDKIVNIFTSDELRLNEHVVKLFVEHFQITNNVLSAFKKFYQSHADNLSLYSLKHLAVLADKPSLEFFANEFLIARINKEIVDNFQACFEKGSELLEFFNELVNKKEKITLPMYRDFENETKLTNEGIKALLFSKDQFKLAIAKVFEDAGKDDLTYDEVWKIQEGQFQGIYSPVVYETIRVFDKNEVLSKSKLLGSIELNWENFTVKEIIKFLKKNKDAQLTSFELAEIRKWCDKQAGIVNFKSALSHPKPDTTTISKVAVRLSFLIRRLKLKHYSQDLYLDMLSVQKWDDDEIDIFEFVELTVDHAQIINRVLSNLREGIEYYQVLEAHLNYCARNNLTQSAQSIIPYLKRPDSPRYTVLDTYLALGGEVSGLELILPEIQGDFKFQLVQALIKLGSPRVEKYLDEIFLLEQGREEKLRIAEFLIQLQDVKGILYYIQYVKATKSVPGDSSPGNPLYQLKDIGMLNHIFRLYEISFDEDIVQDSYNRLSDIAIGALQGICMSNNNFRKANWLFYKYRVIFWMRNLFKPHSYPKSIVLNLTQCFESMEHQYFVNMSIGVSLQEALSTFNQVAKVVN